MCIRDSNGGGVSTLLVLMARLVKGLGVSRVRPWLTPGRGGSSALMLSLLPVELLSWVEDGIRVMF